MLLLYLVFYKFKQLLSMNKKTLYWIWLIALIACPIVLWILPSDFFNDGAIICLSRLIFNIECWGCGLTRAVMHFHHFAFEEAFFYNYAVVLVYPALVWLWFLWTKAAATEVGLLNLSTND